jgi:hypothetical protein
MTIAVDLRQFQLTKVSEEPTGGGGTPNGTVVLPSAKGSSGN